MCCQKGHCLQRHPASEEQQTRTNRHPSNITGQPERLLDEFDHIEEGLTFFYLFTVSNVL